MKDIVTARRVCREQAGLRHVPPVTMVLHSRGPRKGACRLLARLRHASGARECPLIEEDRK
jgi:hypothetical protein